MQRDGGLGGEEEGESGRSAVRILISSNWPPREKKLGDGRQGRKRRERNSQFFDRVISLFLCSSLFPSALFCRGLSVSILFSLHLFFHLRLRRSRFPQTVSFTRHQLPPKHETTGSNVCNYDGKLCALY